MGSTVFKKRRESMPEADILTEIKQWRELLQSHPFRSHT